MSLILGIETSCDETSVALVNSQREVLNMQILSQLDLHQLTGGVVPETAARAHLEHLDKLVAKCLAEANVTWAQIEAIAATIGPGLVGGVMIGSVTAKALALAQQKPFYGINHLEGHALTARLTDNVAYPFLLLLISGAHTQFVAVRGLGDYEILGQTIDDAAGEAFDKCAKMLGLGYPGGPALDRLAASYDAETMPVAEDLTLPQPMRGKPGCDMSFSGLKTAFRYKLEALIKAHGSKAEKTLPDPYPAAIAAAFQTAICSLLIERSQQALALFPEATALVAAGGVAANKVLRAQLQAMASRQGIPFVAPPLKYCGDNAAMIAWAGCERFDASIPADITIAERPRWSLEDLSKVAA